MSVQRWRETQKSIKRNKIFSFMRTSTLCHGNIQKRRAWNVLHELSMTSFSLWNSSWRWLLLIYGLTYPEDMFPPTFHAINLDEATCMDGDFQSLYKLVHKIPHRKIEHWVVLCSKATKFLTMYLEVDPTKYCDLRCISSNGCGGAAVCTSRSG